jgi:hypothetical protein
MFQVSMTRGWHWPQATKSTVSECWLWQAMQSLFISPCENRASYSLPAYWYPPVTRVPNWVAAAAV